MCKDGVIAECCTRMKCIPGEGGGVGVHVTVTFAYEGRKKRLNEKPDFHPKVCVPVQSKPMSYTEIRDRMQVFDIQASLVQVVDRNYMPHDFFFPFFILFF